MPTKITNATATQVSGSDKKASSIGRSSALECLVDRGSDRGRRRRGADQPLDDRRGGIDRDAAHVRHGGGLGGGDLLLGLGEVGVQLRLLRLAALLALRMGLVARLAGDPLGAIARLEERLLVGVKRRLR